MIPVDPLAVDGDGRRPPPERVPLASIQVMRGIDIWGWAAGKGWTGVNFFFVLSGFIIPYAHHGDIGRPSRAGHYLMRRATRVYPIYWVFLTAFIGAAALGLGKRDFDGSWPNLTGAYLLVQIVPVPTLPLKVAWTLFYEIFFYFMFLLLILDRRIGTAVIALWAAAVVGWGLILGHDTDYWYLHSWNLYFAMGALAYVIYRQREGRPGLPILLAGLIALAALAAGGLIDDPLGVAQTHPRTLLLLGPPFALILLGAALIDRRRRWRPAALLALLGEASYAVYLVHSPVISALAQLNHALARRGSVLEPHLIYIAVALIAVAAGVIAHLLVERPLLRAIRRVTDARGRPGAAAAENEQQASAW